MPKVIYIEHNGTRHEVEAPAGDSAMMAALDAGVPGIDADCGGGCSCGTCHVMVDPEWLPLVGQPDAMEESMLSFVPERQPNSRLSCQINLSDALDGLVLRLPESQM